VCLGVCVCDRGREAPPRVLVRREPPPGAAGVPPTLRAADAPLLRRLAQLVTRPGFLAASPPSAVARVAPGPPLPEGPTEPPTHRSSPGVFMFFLLAILLLGGGGGGGGPTESVQPDRRDVSTAGGCVCHLRFGDSDRGLAARATPHTSCIPALSFGHSEKQPAGIPPPHPHPSLSVRHSLDPLGCKRCPGHMGPPPPLGMAPVGPLPWAFAALEWSDERLTGALAARASDPGFLEAADAQGRGGRPGGGSAGAGVERVEELVHTHQMRSSAAPSTHPPTDPSPLSHFGQ